MDGIEKEIDELGRIVIPVKFRKKLGVEKNSKVILSLNGDTVSISAFEKRCALRGGKVEHGSKIRLCSSCVFTVQNKNE